MFQPLTRDTLVEIRTRQNKLSTLSSEFDAFRLYAWLMLDQSEVCFWRDQFVIRCQAQGKTWYVAPPEIEEFQTLLPLLMDYERAHGGRMFRYLNIDRPTGDFPDGFTATPRRDLYDYIYRAESLMELKGRDYAAKRNQIAQFKRKYPWHFEPLSPDNADACRLLIAQWDTVHEGAMLAYERAAIERMLSFSEDFGQSGGLLFVDANPVAFAIGSHPRDALLDILAEKALPQYVGAYSMIIQTYAQYAHSLSPFSYINREEDMGLENLRNAKLQLKPDRLIAKTLMTAPL